MTEYKPIEYAQSFTVPDSTDLLYRKRAWVPDWLWRRVSSPDIPTLIRVTMRKMRQEYEEGAS